MTVEIATLDFSVSASASVKQARFIHPSAGEHLLMTYSKGWTGPKKGLRSVLGEAHFGVDEYGLLEPKNNLCSLHAWCTGGKPLCVQITMV